MEWHRVFKSICLAMSFLLLNVACSNAPQRDAIWLPYEKIRPSLRREIRIEPGQYVRACGSMINVGQFRTAKQLMPNSDPQAEEEIVISDGPSSFYDRRTGELIVACDFWSCSRHPKTCDRYCPPPGWTCGWEMP
jgi:hypothetical protein